MIILFFFTLTTFGQSDSLGFTNKAEAKNLIVNGKKEGKWCELMYNDSLRQDTIGYSLTIYKDDKPHGIQRYYNKEDELYDAIPYVNGLKNGIEKYGTATSANSETPWVNGKKEGVQKSYFLSDSLTWMEKPYHEDLLDGTQRMYYKGKLFHEKVWIKGRLVSDKKFELDAGGVEK